MDLLGLRRDRENIYLVIVLYRALTDDLPKSKIICIYLGLDRNIDISGVVIVGSHLIVTKTNGKTKPSTGEMEADHDSDRRRYDRKESDHEESDH